MAAPSAYLKASFALAIALMPLLAQAGNGTDRGGGDVIVCGKNRFYLADTFSLRDTPAWKKLSELNKHSAKDIFRSLLGMIREQDPEAADYLESKVDPARKGHMEFVPFVEPRDKKGKILRKDLRQGGLPELDDDNIDLGKITAQDCRNPGKKQLAIQFSTQTGSQVTYDELITKRLTRLETALFWIHEGFIRHRIEFPDGSTDTSGVRKKVSMLSSSPSFADLVEAIASFRTTDGALAWNFYRTATDLDEPRGARAQFFTGWQNFDDYAVVRRVLAHRFVAVARKSLLTRAGETLDPELTSRRAMDLIDLKTRAKLVRLHLQCVGQGITATPKGEVLIPIYSPRSCQLDSFEITGKPVEGFAEPDQPAIRPSAVRIRPAPADARPEVPLVYDPGQFSAYIAEFEELSLGALRDRLNLRVFFLLRNESCRFRRASLEKGDTLGRTSYAAIAYAEFTGSVHARDGEEAAAPPLRLRWIQYGSFDPKTLTERTGRSMPSVERPGFISFVLRAGAVPLRFITTKTSPPEELACMDVRVRPEQLERVTLSFDRPGFTLGKNDRGSGVSPDFAEAEATRPGVRVYAELVRGSPGSALYGRVRGTHLNHFRLTAFETPTFRLSARCSGDKGFDGCTIDEHSGVIEGRAGWLDPPLYPVRLERPSK